MCTPSEEEKSIMSMDFGIFMTGSHMSQQKTIEQYHMVSFVG